MVSFHCSGGSKLNTGEFRICSRTTFYSAHLCFWPEWVLGLDGKLLKWDVSRKMWSSSVELPLFQVPIIETIQLQKFMMTTLSLSIFVGRGGLRMLLLLYIILSNGIATWGSRGAECHPWQRKICQKSGKNQEKSRKKEEKSGRKGKSREGSFTLPLLTDRTGYATDS